MALSSGLSRGGTSIVVAAVALFVALGGSVAASDDARDLTLGNLTEGWNEEWTKRPHAAPDMALLRVQTNFLEREFRANYFFEDDIHSKKRRDLSEAEALVAYGLSRRFMLEVVATYDDFTTRGGPDDQGAAGAIVGRFQLVDAADSSYSLNLRAASPNDGTGDRQTTLSYGLAGFEDLTNRLGLHRVGLYYSALFATHVGPAEAGARRDDVSYDVSVAKTLTEADQPFFGDFTVFVETFAQSLLDGDPAGRTSLSFTPGLRFDLGGHNWLMAGVDLPVNTTTARPYRAGYRATYIKSF